MQLPEEFISYTSAIFGEERWHHYLDSFNQEVPVSIRLNPFKQISPTLPVREEDVPWCRNAYWLKERPKFTLDPLLHAGAYYVQEAGSMFLDQVMRQYVNHSTNTQHPTPITMLDLCAAPGGKSTLARAALPQGSLLFANEPDRKRSNILLENLQKQGHPDIIVTNSYPRDYARTKLMFDVILTDVPCSGEGMFRRDEGAISEWNLQNVRKCAELQRSIVSDIWPRLQPGGLLIYSTCTFNLKEDEENVRWIADELGADILPVDVSEEWNITGSLLDGWDYPVYRFIPGTTRSEGLFMAVLRKHGDYTPLPVDKKKAISLAKSVHIIYDGVPRGEKKGKDIIPDHAEALQITSTHKKAIYPEVELSLDEALRYLHREALTLPSDTPRGYVIMTYQGYHLGFMKNIGNRANNLYPKEWAIKNL